MTDRFRIGVIVSTHGLKGEVKVFPTTEDPQRFRDLTDVLLTDTDGNILKPLKVQSVRFFKQFAIVKFRDHDRIEDIEPYVKKELYVTRENALPLEEGEYYVADLIGLSVYTDEGEKLGELTEVLQTGANDVYVVSANGTEILIPVIPDCILNVDTDGGKVLVHLLEGLR